MSFWEIDDGKRIKIPDKKVKDMEYEKDKTRDMINGFFEGRCV